MSTVGYYDEHAEAFFQETVGADMSAARGKFLLRLPAKGRVLDAGCGSGRDARAFADAGYAVTAFDASEELVRRAKEYTGLPVLKMSFEDVDWRDEFDGIWACASLLHVPAERLVPVMVRLSAALKLNGTLYGSFKYGTGEAERGGRYFTDLDEKGLSDLVSAVPGLSLVETWQTPDVRPGRSDRWLNFLCTRLGSDALAGSA